MNPWWVSAIKTIGVPSTMAGVLLWWVLHTLSPVLFDVKGMMETHVQETHVLAQQNGIVIKILRANCINGAFLAQPIQRDQAIGRCNE